MKTLMMTGIAFIASAGATFAADAVIAPGPFEAPPAYPATVTPGPFDAPPAYPQSKVYDWTGFYLGINGGGAFNRIDWFSGPDAIGGTQDVDSGLVGGTAGYNLQANEPVVVGFEADIDWSSLKGTVSPPTCLTGCQLTLPWLATGRLRIGYAFDRFLPYLTGGVALGNLSADIPGSPFGTETGRNLGWTAGVGAEFVISGPLTAKIEYLYVDLRGLTCDGACNGGPVSFNYSSDVVRAGLDYRFWMH